MNDVLDRTRREVPPSEQWRERVLASLSERLDELVATHELTDFSPGAEHATVNAMTDAVRTASRINDRLGAFFTTERVRVVLGGVSRQAVSERVRNHRLLRVTTSDGKTLFPTFQFNNGAVLPGLQGVLQVLLASGADGWTVAYWLTAHSADLGGQTPLEVVASGDTDRVAEVTRLAAEDAAGWRKAS